MKPDASFVEYVRDQLRTIPGCSFRGMFGGHGIYWSRAFFGIIADGRLYFKTDDASRPDFAQRGMEPFRPGPRTTLKSFYEVPIDVLEDAALLAEWARRSAGINAARRPAKR
jgi:DNA transformation protein